MKQIVILQQVLNPVGIGGVTAEYNALKRTKLTNIYRFETVILKDIHSSINFQDIYYYYKHICICKPDILHVRGAAVDGLNAIIAGKLAGRCKILTTVHGLYSDLVYINPIKKFIAHYLIEPLIFYLSDGISCVYKGANYRPCFNRFRNKLLPHVYNRIPQFDLSRRTEMRESTRNLYTISQTDFVCVYVGRITREKGFITLEKMISKYSKLLPNKLVFLFVGDGEYKEKFQKYVKSFDVRCIFTGVQTNIQKYLFASDFFIFPSLHENHSIALLEACAAKLPIIATECGGNIEIIKNNKTGILVPINDSDALYSSICKFCNSDILKNYQRNLECESFTEFSDSACDCALDTVYKGILHEEF